MPCTVRVTRLLIFYLHITIHFTWVEELQQITSRYMEKKKQHSKMFFSFLKNSHFPIFIFVNTIVRFASGWAIRSSISLSSMIIERDRKLTGRIQNRDCHFCVKVGWVERSVLYIICVISIPICILDSLLILLQSFILHRFTLLFQFLLHSLFVIIRSYPLVRFRINFPKCFVSCKIFPRI